MSTDFIHLFIPAPSAGSPDPAGAATASGAGTPTLLVLHGTGGNEEDLIPVARIVSADAAILSPRGKILERGMPRFFRRLAEGVFDMEDLKVRTAELGRFVEESASRYGFDPSRVFAVGYSNGANVAASLMLSAPGVLAGGVLLRPMVPFEPEPLPDLSGTPVLLSAGRNDPIVPPPSTERLAEILRASGAEVTLAWQAAGHQLLRPELDAAAAWFAAHASRKP